MPDLKFVKVDLADIKDEAQRKKEEQWAQEVEEEAQRISEWIPTAMRRLQEIAKMRGPQRRINAVEATQIREDLTKVLSHEVPEYRRAARKSYIVFCFGLSVFLDGAEKNLALLVKDGFLVEDREEGDLWAPGRAYKVTPDSCFEEQDINEIKNAFRRFIETMAKNHLASLKRKASKDLTLDDFFARRPGVYLVEVPGEYVARNGVVRHYHGGQVLVRSSGKSIYPLDGTNALGVGFRDAAEMGLYVWMDSIDWDTRPTPRGWPEERVRRFHLCWHTLRRVRTHAEALRQGQEFEDEMRKKYQDTLVSSHDFLVDNAVGVCCISLTDWEERDGEGNIIKVFPRVDFQVARENGTPEGTIEVLETRGPSAVLLAECEGKQYPDGKRYENCTPALRKLLQAARGRALEAAQD